MSTRVRVLLRRPHLEWAAAALAAALLVAMLPGGPGTVLGVVAGVVLAGLLAVPVAGRIVLRRYAADLLELNAWVAGVDVAGPARRVPVPQNPGLRRLAASLSDLLRRVEEASVRQGRCIEDTAHDLRTPLAVIRGALELPGADLESTRALAIDEVERMNEIITHLLALTDAGRRDGLDVADVDVPDLLADVVARARLMAERDWRCGEVVAAGVRADRACLIRALLQLAGNAAGHTSEGDVIELGAEASSGRVRVWVHDNGPGVHERDKDRIFERGWVRALDGNHGLGLAIVRSIAHAHGGEVYLEDRGRGACFVLDLPAARPVPRTGHRPRRRVMRSLRSLRRRRPASPAAPARGASTR